MGREGEGNANDEEDEVCAEEIGKDDQASTYRPVIRGLGG